LLWSRGRKKRERHTHTHKDTYATKQCRKLGSLDVCSRNSRCCKIRPLVFVCGPPTSSICHNWKSGSSEKLSELVDPNLVLPSVLPFKRSQLTDRYPKGQTRGRHWKHLKQILQAENYHLYPADEPTYVNIEAPPSMYPAKKYCDITGFEVRKSARSGTVA
jgi:hypothetical protein